MVLVHILKIRYGLGDHPERGSDRLSIILLRLDQQLEADDVPHLINHNSLLFTTAYTVSIKRHQIWKISDMPLISGNDTNAPKIFNHRLSGGYYINTYEC